MKIQQCAFSKWKLLTGLPSHSLSFIFNMASMADFNSVALLIQYSNVVNILKCKDFGAESNECYSNRAWNQIFVLLTCGTREKERTEDLSKPEMTG